VNTIVFSVYFIELVHCRIQ